MELAATKQEKASTSGSPEGGWDRGFAQVQRSYLDDELFVAIPVNIPSIALGQSDIVLVIVEDRIVWA